MGSVPPRSVHDRSGWCGYGLEEAGAGGNRHARGLLRGSCVVSRYGVFHPGIYVRECFCRYRSVLAIDAVVNPATIHSPWWDRAAFPAEPTRMRVRAGGAGQGRPQAARIAGCLDRIGFRRATLTCSGPRARSGEQMRVPYPAVSGGLLLATYVLRPRFVGAPKQGAAHQRGDYATGVRRSRPTPHRQPSTEANRVRSAGRQLVMSLHERVAAWGRAVSPTKRGRIARCCKDASLKVVNV
jgi:hypothetical protein